MNHSDKSVSTPLAQPSEEVQRIITGLGFVPGTGWTDRIVWTNPNTTFMAQVWIVFSGKADENFSLQFDARGGFSLERFFQWWVKISEEEFSPGFYGVGSSES